MRQLHTDLVTGISTKKYLSKPNYTTMPNKFDSHQQHRHGGKKRVWCPWRRPVAANTRFALPPPPVRC